MAEKAQKKHSILDKAKGNIKNRRKRSISFRTQYVCVCTNYTTGKAMVFEWQLQLHYFFRCGMNLFKRGAPRSRSHRFLDYS